MSASTLNHIAMAFFGVLLWSAAAAANDTSVGGGAPNGIQVSAVTAPVQLEPVAPESTASAESKDVMFAHNALKAGMQEVADARNARRLAKREDVRSIALLLGADHIAANKRLAELSRTKANMSSIPAIPRASELAGADFDAAYLNAQVAKHETTIAMYRQQVTLGADPELRAYAEDTLAILEKHLVELRRLQQ